MIDFDPYGDRIVVRLIEAEKESAGGVILPEAALERPQRGTVIKVGPGARNESTGERMAIPVVPGDVVLFSKYGGHELALEGDHLLIREIDLLGVESK